MYVTYVWMTGAESEAVMGSVHPVFRTSILHIASPLPGSRVLQPLGNSCLSPFEGLRARVGTLGHNLLRQPVSKNCTVPTRARVDIVGADVAKIVDAINIQTDQETDHKAPQG